ncbi:hypothetical protein ALC62_10467 [Cyphomyrmex costatus]|uniref:Uncharacterized protein n=1 Tax=Cyphomyrmex costatus TaxID=456900 RepID=A0A151K2E8_9HYME|nr:hypothetical protein ALC62_10467 [Cyphomyrmex costatus]
MGNEIPAGSISLANLLDEDSLNRIADSAGKRVWKGFVTFGSASAGVLAIFIIIRTTKLVIDTMIHGYALHTMYGWSLHLVGAIWSSVTHLLLHLGNRRSSRPQEDTHAETSREATGPTAPLSALEDEPSVTFSLALHKMPMLFFSPLTLSIQPTPTLYRTYTYSDLRKHLDNNTPHND